MADDFDPARSRSGTGSTGLRAATDDRARSTGRSPDESDRLVVIGASAGGVEALQRVVRALPSSFPAPIVVVLHLPSTAVSRLPEILDRAGPVPARQATDGGRLEPGVILVAPPDRHVICSDHRLALVEGPRENGVRPAIDPLFRSAARIFGNGTIGVILSGTLDDGTAGIAAIHAGGGVTIAQEPSDAICPGMPQGAIENATIDHVAPADELGDLLVRLVRTPAADGRSPRSPSLHAPSRRSGPSDRDARASSSTDLVCPECGGVLRRFEENGVLRFHCRVGHTYSGDALFDAQDARLEAALWAAIRSLEESASLARRLATSARDRGAIATAQRFDNRELEAAQRADLIRSAILAMSDLEEVPPAGEPEPVSSEDDADRARSDGSVGPIEHDGRRATGVATRR
jgi:two-component system chemotaxis response regulator CheB